MQKKILLLLSLLTFFISTALALPLSTDEAFQFSATAKDNQTIIGIWQIAPGYYLYRDRITFHAIKPEENRLGQPLFPYTNKSKEYPGVGKLSVYTGNLRVPVPILQSVSNPITVTATYQGCSQNGFCYPPTTKIVQINLNGNYLIPVQPLNIDIPTPVHQEPIKPALQENPMSFLLHNPHWSTIIFGCLVFGLLLSLTPCVLPMIPVLSSIIVGQKTINHARSFMLSLSYVLGMAITYAIAGMLFGLLGGSVQAFMQKPWIIALFSLLFILMALSLFGFYQLQLPNRLRSKIAHLTQHQKHSIIGAAIMGILSTLILSPCVTPPLVAILGYISQSGNAFLGGIALFSMGIGMGIPLLIIGASGAALLPKAGHWMNAIKNILGVLMLAMAIWILSRILPEIITLYLWIILAIGSAIALGTFSTAKQFWKLCQKILGIALFIYAIILIFNSFHSNTNPYHPFANIVNRTNSSPELSFIKIKSVADFLDQAKIAALQKKSVMLDFYANWCISCREMDTYTFTNTSVIKQLNGVILLRADVSQNDMTDKSLLQHFNVVAPPTILFFDKEGHEIPNSRIVGEMDARKFSEHLTNLDF